jgi:paired amphipathic helix protein Sin3a
MYLKSLDHMGIQVKQSDKKNLAAKHLVDAIKTKHEEQRRQRSTQGKFQKHQFTYTFLDQEVIADVLRFMIIYVNNAPQHSPTERRRISDFFEKFVATFFDLSEEVIADCTRDVDRGTPDDEYEDVAPVELSNGRGRRPANGKKNNDLRRGVLDKSRNGTRGRGQKEDSASGSKESTPDVDSVAGDDAGEVTEDHAVTEVTNERWAAVPGAIAMTGTKSLYAEDLELKADQSFKRDWYKLYGNQTIYVFFTVFHTLYLRLKQIKDSEQDAVEEGIRMSQPKPAKDIGLIPEKDEYFQPVADPKNEKYYPRTLQLIDDFIAGDLEEAKYQDFLRHYYLKNGWRLYTITEVLKSLCRLGSVCSSTDAKEKTPDLMEQFYRNRQTDETSYNAEINMRKQADKYIKDGELFLIEWVCVKRNSLQSFH